MEAWLHDRPVDAAAGATTAAAASGETTQGSQRKLFFLDFPNFFLLSISHLNVLKDKENFT